MSDLSSKYVLQTAGFDGQSLYLLLQRATTPTQPSLSSFPQPKPDASLNYTDYFKCIAARGEDYAPCKQFKRAYNSLCPNEWIGKWDEQRESGTFPASLEP
ncbi:transporter [Ganoderma sinense ZZ0214-1]|uniref:Transporter n=1 Tax=Ganoderma sinense ZZ0214-1 TaxID=1077348 RepID=A0A2G8S7Y1_9APHY|nr:transporter [Ganoderma sinense ZZ0214-1]